MRTTIFLGVACLVGLAAAACGEAATTATLNAAPPSSDGGTKIVDGQVVNEKGVVVWDDTKAIAWLNQYCANCHGIDDAGQKGLYYSAWPMPKPLTREWLETSDYTPAAYQTILHRIANVKGPPSPMPTQEPANDQERNDLNSAVDWFTRRVPFAVIDANKRYGNATELQQKVVANFQCPKTMSLRKFLTAVTLGVFDRYPNAGELGFFQPAELNAPVTLQARQHIASWFDSQWKYEFMNVGLRKLANVIGGAPTIVQANEVSDAQIADLREEFYQQLLAHYNDWNYGEFFKTNTVMVSPNTASLYAGCTPPASGWAACNLQAPRKTFFTTRGYLISKPSSFLVQNNNYGRTALMFFTLYGEKLFAATDGPTGEGIPPLPDCLEPTDTRTFTGAPRGTAAVPKSGSVCQGCHIARGLAAGSILFRPFAKNGAVYDTATIATASNPDKKIWDEFFDRQIDGQTVATLWGYVAPGATTPAPVSVEYMNKLLTDSTTAPMSCVASGNKANPYIKVADLSQLVDEYLKTTTSFSRGFTRHAQRAFMNQTAVTLEMSVKASAAYDSGQQKIGDLLKAYFLSDTLTCEE